MTDGALIPGPPSATSLFNLTTLKELLRAGQQTVDVTMFNQYTDDLDLSEFTNVTTTLGLASSEQTYMIYLWLKYARDQTLERTQDGGNLELGLASQLGAKAFQRTMNTMEAELPNILYASEFKTAFLNTQTNCSLFYYNTLNFTQQVAT